jgi:A/G-specific adenine glycosylase
MGAPRSRTANEADPLPPAAAGSDAVPRVTAWYEEHQRPLPWRAPDRTPWGVLTSEVMLQQTPAQRVVPAWTVWMARWPTPAALSAATSEDVVRQWGRLGYPRRALALHRTANILVDRHGGLVPDDEAALRSLPGVGEYTAAAVRAFAFGHRSIVLDTNVRRVLARAVTGREHPPPSLTVAERRIAEALAPTADAMASRWAVAVMELGALVCTSARPRCAACPLATSCAWRRAGKPPYDGPPRRTQRYVGSDRQVRGLLMELLRAAPEPLSRSALEPAWPDALQRDRCLSGLVEDGLVDALPRGRFRLGAGRRRDQTIGGEDEHPGLTQDVRQTGTSGADPAPHTQPSMPGSPTRARHRAP